MNDRELEKTMDTWAAQEMASAPDMRPTAEMVRLVRAKRKRKDISPSRVRWAIAALAVTALAALLYVAIFRPAFLFHRPVTGQLAHVGQRAGFGEEKSVVVRTPTPQGKGGSEKGSAFFAQFMLELDRAEASQVVGIDLRAVQKETISLTSADNYRLLLDPAQMCYLYVFQYISSGVLVQLFPGETYSVVQNPLSPGQQVYLPSEPNWLYVSGDEGRDRLYVIASAQRQHDLETMHTQYLQADDMPSKQKALDSLLGGLDVAGTALSREVSKWLIVLDH
jgi:hypothetical protein